MAKNSHRPNGQRHQVSSLHSAALRVILVLEFICWEVASPSSAFAVPAMLLHRGTTSGFQAFGVYAFGCVLKTAQTADTGVTVRGLHFVVRLFRKTLNFDLTFTLIYGYNISMKVGDRYVF